ncbi:TPA: hypothetical protein QDB14_001018 [Burkholderia vietnamiensis]|nr:hypothetical protein [Burkholderia vietnamiensis]
MELTVDQKRQALLDAGYSIEPNSDPSNHCLFIVVGPSGGFFGDDESALIEAAYDASQA